MLSIGELERKFYQERYAPGLSTGRVVERENLFPNPNMVDISGCSPHVSTTITVSTDVAPGWPKNGTTSLKVTSTAVNSSTSARQHYSRRVPASIGESFSASAWFQNATGVAADCILYVRFFDAEPTDNAVGNIIATAATTVNIPNGSNSNLIVENAVAPAGTKSVGLIFVCPSDTIGDSFYVDRVILNKGSQVIPYFDGNSADFDNGSYEWESTVNNSVSRLYVPEPVVAGTEFTTRIPDINSRNSEYLERSYWAKTSGLTPVEKYSIADHQMASLKASEGMNGTINDLLNNFFRRQSGLPASASASDHELAFYQNKLGVS